MKKLLIILIFACTNTILFAQNKIQVFEENNFTALVQKHGEMERIIDTEKGYRIQIKFTSDKSELNDEKVHFYANYPTYKAYIIYDQPNYKLRIGDFRNRLEATKALMEITPLYPGAFIVRDEIKLK